MDQSLHVLLHCCSRRRGDLVIFDADRSRGHLVQALVDDSERLPEFFHSAEISVVAVAIDANWDIEIDFTIGIVRLALSDIPRHTGTSKHNTGEGKVQGVRSRNNTNSLSPSNPDTVVC